MPMTFPSKILTILDLPEPKNIKAEFIYNFFVSDEIVNGESDNFKSTVVNSKDSKFISRNLPRYNKISWSAVNIVSSNKIEKNKQARSDGADIFNSQNINMIQNEQSFSNFDFVGISFQDSTIDEKLFDIISGSSDIRKINNESFLETSKEMNKNTRKTVDGNSLIELLSNNKKRGIFFENDKMRNDKFLSVKNLSVRAQINNKIVGTVIRNSSEDSLNIYADEMSSMIKNAEKIQISSLQKKSAGNISTIDWDSGFIPVVMTKLSPNDNACEVTNIQGGGFIVDRDEIDNFGNIVESKNILIVGLNATALLDFEIKYNSNYRYRVRTVAVLTLPGTDADGNLVLMKGLVSSQFSNSSLVSCIEHVAPPAPADFKPVWDYSKKALHLLWSFPVNSQRDIKYFQIFRRKSLNEPFELLKMYDFNDSVVKIESNETIDESLIVSMKDPITFFTDNDFTKESSFIYAICSIDAHGISSNFSQQYIVSFDRFANKLLIKLFSQSGAPKAYPNMFLNNDAFIDTIKTSGYKRASIYFDPEYLTIHDSDKQDLNLFPFDDPNAVFKIQMINTDVQLSQIIDINLIDKRKQEKITETSSQFTKNTAHNKKSGLQPS